MVSRRSFLKILGAGAAAVVAAPIIKPASAGPLFIPAQHLDLGVPRRILTAIEMPPASGATPAQVGQIRLPNSTPVVYRNAPNSDSIPMMLLQSEFRPPFWQQFGRMKVPAGTTLMVDETTAERWVRNNIAVPGPAAPIEMQRESARLRLERMQAAAEKYFQDYVITTEWDD